MPERENIFFICRMEKNELEHVKNLTGKIKKITNLKTKHVLTTSLKSYLDKISPKKRKKKDDIDKIVDTNFKVYADKLNEYSPLWGDQLLIAIERELREMM